jgi:hypothetical protein
LCYFAEEVETRRTEEEIKIKEAALQPWLINHILETVGSVNCMTQLEVDRFVNTTGVLKDYMVLSLQEDRQPKHWRFEPTEEIGKQTEQEWTVNLASLLLAEELPDQSLPDSFVAHCQCMVKAATAYVNELVMIICTEIEKTENKFKLKAEKNEIKPIMTKNDPTLGETFYLIDMKQKCLAAQQLQLLQASYFFL